MHLGIRIQGHSFVLNLAASEVSYLRASESCCRRGWFSLFWLSSGMYWDMMDMISESMYDCNTTAKSFQMIELPSAQTLLHSTAFTAEPCILFRWTYPEPVLVEDVAGDPDAYDARHGRDGDEPAELRHVVSCVTGPEEVRRHRQMADA